MPLWIKSSLVILLSISMATWFAGERVRHLDEEYLLQNIRGDKIRIVKMLAGLVSNPVLQKNQRSIDNIIKQYTSSWPEMTYVHILDDRGNGIYEWQKKPISFPASVRHFEQPVTVGGEVFGTLSVYFDLDRYFRSADSHIGFTRRNAASILLSITLFLVFLVNYVTSREGYEGHL